MSENHSGRGTERDADVDRIQLVFREATRLVSALEGTSAQHVTVIIGSLHVEITRQVQATTVQPAPSSGEQADGMVPVVAPLVGIFYRASAPGTRPFVEVGDVVEPGQVVGIVEAMKVMNKVFTEHAGRVARVLVDNGAAVHYEQPLVLIDTAG
jgi:acetyl-CoA carboxylase biotin carboxyl carrier protein